MILPDANLLIYAYNSDAPQHDRARDWWEDALSGTDLVGLSWFVLAAYMRLMTGRAVRREPFHLPEVVAHVRGWLARPQAVMIQPGPRHLDLFEELMGVAGGGSSLTMDAHLAALAIEHDAVMHSNDSDFSRFPGLRWVNPLRSSATRRG